MSVATDSRGNAWGSGCRASDRRARVRRPVTRHASPWTGPIAGALALLSLMAFVGVMPTATELAATPTAAASSIRVAPSDSLWSIAQAHRIPGTTTAETVERIMSLNGLKDATLQPGEIISIPTDELPSTAFAQSETEARAN